MICYIFGAGEFKGTGFPCPSVNDLVIAADGGLAHAESMGLKPSVVLGDFDSLGKKPTGNYQTITFPPEKDYTDLIIVNKYGIEVNPYGNEFIDAIIKKVNESWNNGNLQTTTLYKSIFKTNKNHAF